MYFVLVMKDEEDVVATSMCDRYTCSRWSTCFWGRLKIIGEEVAVIA